MTFSSNTSINNQLNNFCVIGVNYHKSDIAMRGKFSLSENQTLLFLKESALIGFNPSFVLSTCNRTEVYSICSNPENLVELLCSNTQSNLQDFFEYGYIYQGLQAIEHLFKVASGLDSQIIGDYEILAQLKQATKLANEYGCMNNLMQRVINYAFQASKEIKTKTKISSGTVSVSYAAIEIIKKKITKVSDKNFLLVGTGKFGKNVAKNLKNYFPESRISFTNRTDEKALELANQYEARFISYENLHAGCNDADIIIVSSAAESYTILPSFFTTSKPRLILDLSVPQNADPLIKNIAGIHLLNLDEVSTILDKTVSIRQAEVPKALKIIDNALEELIGWSRNQYNHSLLSQVKTQLYELSESYLNDNSNEEKINETVSSLAKQLKHKTNKGCECINALNRFLQNSSKYNLSKETNVLCKKLVFSRN
jgi:glutamyl-tRNA reductase